MKPNLQLPLILIALCAPPLSAQQEAASEAIPYKEDHELNDKLGQSQAYRNRLITAIHPRQQLRQRYGIAHARELAEPLGIYTEQDGELILTLDHAPRGVELLIYHVEQRLLARHPLHIGENRLRAPHAGLCHLYYPSDKPAQAAPIKLQIKGGKINGLYHLGDGAKAWDFMKRHTVNGYIQILSDQLHLILPASRLAALDGAAIDRLIRGYEQHIARQQRIVGLGHYTPRPSNRFILLPWSADTAAQHEQGILINVQLLPELLMENRLESSFATIARLMHASYSTLIPEGQGELIATMSRLLLEAAAYRQLKPSDKRPTTGPYASSAQSDYITKVINERQLWNAAMSHELTPSSRESYLLRDLAPLWALYLYTAEVTEDDSFLPRLMERLRLLSTEKLSPSAWRIAFLKALCDASRLDLTEFFLQTRMLAPMNRTLGTGARQQTLTITLNDIKSVWQHAQKYPTPSSRILHLLHAGNVQLYRDQRPLLKTGVSPLSPALHRISIPTGYLSGAVAYEVSAGAQSLQITQPLPSKTGSGAAQLDFPNEATRLEAIGWDGTRLLLYER